MKFRLNKQQEKLMTSAGFIPDKGWNDFNHKDGRPMDLYYWKRGVLLICLAASENITLDKLVDFTITQTEYHVKRNFNQSFKKLVYKN